MVVAIKLSDKLRQAINTDLTFGRRGKRPPRAADVPFRGKTGRQADRAPRRLMAPLRHADRIEQCPLSGVTRKTFAHTEFFSV
jgi:hypothetical protein